ncbi:HAMP domain-containing histidine kinase [Loktanella sp. TSTF-M6]|uniref:histidine kinase n=1 Tax=Loktanella gaetbuli TaxID=2881335 RepID=A0ABS8BVK7_9RHOB|nr:HAMP domain-containing sensor histidine kinase [Loktanella gaetbuli]MCB5199766.1 HAMP domain-containing histidine kinase [Loktanella gaetbuli]
MTSNFSTVTALGFAAQEYSFGSSSLLDTLSDPVIGLAADRDTIIYMNAAARALFDATEVGTRTLTSIPFQTGQDALKAALARQQTSRSEAHVSYAGQLYCIEYQRCGLYDEAPFLLILRNRQAGSSGLSDDFVATVSHELRTPLTSVKGALGLALSGASGPITDQTRKLLDIAHRNVGRLMLLVNDILDLEKMSSGNMTFDMVPTDLRAVIDAACEANADFAQGYGVNVICDMPDNPAMALLDADRMHQVMTNLISNACKFSHKGGTITIVLFTQDDGSHRINVTDRGIGIPADALETIFERFNQAGSIHRNRSGSTGLGLAIVKTIIESHDGSIALSSTQDQGTTVTITLADASPSDEDK